MFNPMKNCGKFHFRFYLLCCSVTYVCIKVRIHVQTDEMNEQDKFICDSFKTGDGSEEQASSKGLNQLILDMARPIYNKGMTLNFNNYYASPGVLIALLRHKVLARGMLRRNKRLIPRYILFTKAEAMNKESRGSIKMTVNEKYSLIAAGWVDGNPVHIVSSADTTELTQVRRRVDSESQWIQAPEAVANYNKGMDGVDRHDQYRSLISLCSRHGFKKYAVKLMLALVDIAITSANLHFKLRWKGVQGSPMSSLSRVDFFKDIADKLMSHDRKWAVDAGTISGTEPSLPNEAMARLFSRERSDTVTNDTNIVLEENGTSQRCCLEALEKYDNMISKVSKKCQICEFEGRGSNRYKNVLICHVYGIRACGVTRKLRSLQTNQMFVHGANEPVTDFSWMCPDDQNLTCMEKFHNFYLPQKLFKNRPVSIRADGEEQKVKVATLILKSDLYIKRDKAHYA